MAQRTQLAEHYVKFSVDGLKQAEDATTKTAGKVAQTWAGLRKQLATGFKAAFQKNQKDILGDMHLGNAGKAAQVGNLQGALKSGALQPILKESAQLDAQLAKLNKRMAFEKLRAEVGTVRANLYSVRDGLNQVGAKMAGITGKMAAFAAPAAGLLAFARSAMQGTREGDQMATSWMYLTKVIGSMFAPAIRAGTMLIVKVADVIMGLSPATKTWIVALALGATGLVALSGAVTLAVFAFSGLATAAGIAWAIVTSPIVLTIAAIVAVGVAIALLVDTFSTGSENMATSMNGANDNWVTNLLKGIKTATMAAATFFNWFMKKSDDIGKNFTTGLSVIGEKLGILEKGTTQALLEDQRRAGGPVQIDTDKLSKEFDKFIAGAGKAMPDWKDIKQVPGLLGKLLNQGGMKFKPSLDVKFEGFQQTWDRLQEAMAKGTEEDRLKEIRDENKKTNELLDKILGKLGLGAIVGP